jgi:hypothetical protein
MLLSEGKGYAAKLHAACIAKEVPTAKIGNEKHLLQGIAKTHNLDDLKKILNPHHSLLCLPNKGKPPNYNTPAAYYLCLLP